MATTQGKGAKGRRGEPLASGKHGHDLSQANTADELASSGLATSLYDQ